ncbi:hypothetical protein C0J52_28320, partial [Blattella germanica]
DLTSTDNRVLFCGACEKTIGTERRFQIVEKRFQIVQHIDTAKHKENIIPEVYFDGQRICLLLFLLGEVN